MRRTILCSLLPLLLAGCPCAKRRTYTPPTAAMLMASLSRQGKRVRTMRAKGKADQWTKKGRFKLTVFILTTASGKLRFEAVHPTDPLDRVAVVFTSDSTSFASINRRSNVFLSGPAKPCIVARVFGLALDPKDVGKALVGVAPVIAHSRASVEWDRCEGADVLRLVDSSGKLEQRIWMKRVRPGVWLAARSEVRNDKGKLLAELLFERRRKVDGLLLPRVIKLRQTKPRADIIIRFKTQKTDVEIPEDAFRLTAPPGMPERVLTCP